MQETGEDYNATAKWFLLEYDELLDEWLKPEEVKKMKEVLKGNGNEKDRGSFPITMPINLESIDKSVREFSVKHSKFFLTVLKIL